MSLKNDSAEMGSLEFSPINRLKVTVTEDLELAYILINKILAKYGSESAAWSAIGCTSVGIVVQDFLKFIQTLNSGREENDDDNDKNNENTSSCLVFDLIDQDKDGIVLREEWKNAFYQIPLHFHELVHHNRISESSDFMSIIDIRKQMQLATLSDEQLHQPQQKDAQQNQFRNRSQHSPSLGRLVRKCIALQQTSSKDLTGFRGNNKPEKFVAITNQGTLVDKDQVAAIFGALHSLGMASPALQTKKPKDQLYHQVKPLSSVINATTLLQRNLSHSPQNPASNQKRQQVLILGGQPVTCFGGQNTFLTHSPIKSQHAHLLYSRTQKQQISATGTRTRFQSFLSRAGPEIQRKISSHGDPDAGSGVYKMLRMSMNERVQTANITGSDIKKLGAFKTAGNSEGVNPTIQQGQQQQTKPSALRNGGGGLESVIHLINYKQGNLRHQQISSEHTTQVKSGIQTMSRIQQRQVHVVTTFTAGPAVMTTGSFIASSKQCEIDGSLERFRLISTMTAAAKQAAGNSRNGGSSNNVQLESCDNRMNPSNLAFFRIQTPTAVKNSSNTSGNPRTSKHEIQQTTSRFFSKQGGENRKVLSILDQQLHDQTEQKKSFLQEGNISEERNTPKRTQRRSRPECFDLNNRFN